MPFWPLIFWPSLDTTDVAHDVGPYQTDPL